MGRERRGCERSTCSLFVDDQSRVLTAGFVGHLRLIQVLLANLGNLDGCGFAVLGRRHHDLLCKGTESHRVSSHSHHAWMRHRRMIGE